MPTQDKLKGLYDAGRPRLSRCFRNHNIHVATELIDITCIVPWASDSAAAYFHLEYGGPAWNPPFIDYSRALPVRFVN